MTLKMAVEAPMPRARVTAAMMVKLGLLRRLRRAKRMSWPSVPMNPPEAERCVKVIRRAVVKSSTHKSEKNCAYGLGRAHGVKVSPKTGARAVRHSCGAGQAYCVWPSFGRENYCERRATACSRTWNAFGTYEPGWAGLVASRFGFFAQVSVMSSWLVEMRKS